ncbi:GxxExxY protein [Luteolibacter ambystomatis]|uniref:GxxExxY protein n=1 Tax=Luteolibacter ambystomatis TaxID=2824561 RepID=A0A975J3I0_9BACT|nr:GxxExxY protein [Luteolibacter ambystomatis]QUE53354.1 GxxExxY protein [Luteolibacter ambystomatis]
MKTNDEREYDLAGRVIGCAMTVHRVLGPGFNERVYQNALSLELAAVGIQFENQVKLCVYYKERPVGDFEADMIVENNLVLELKAVETITKSHEVQLVNYLATTKIDEGLLINLGSDSLQYRKKFRTYKHQGDPPSLQA